MATVRGSMYFGGEFDRNKALAKEIERRQLQAILDGREPAAGQNAHPGWGGGPIRATQPAPDNAANDRRLAAELAAKAAEQASLNRQKEATLDSDLDERRKRDAAARALALFRATGPSGAGLATGAARGELA